MRLIILTLLILSVAGGLPAEEIIDLIKRGKIDEARQEIGEASTAARRDGTLLYYEALLETDGARSFEFLQAAFKAEMSPRFLEDNIYLMSLYYFAEGDYSKVVSTAETYLQHWEAGRFRTEMQRLAALAFSLTGDKKKADSYGASMIKENEGRLDGFYGKLDKAYRLYQNRDYISAQNICRRLRQVEYDDIAAAALYMLSYYAIEQKRIDDAILYYNILREGFPHAIGRDDLIDRFSRFESKGDDRRAEEMTGTVYSIQIGVFSIKDNAKRLADRMKQYGEKVEIKDKIISEKKYYVVYVGRFKSSQDAMAFKSRLELSEKEAFQVIAR